MDEDWLMRRLASPVAEGHHVIVNPHAEGVQKGKSLRRQPQTSEEPPVGARCGAEGDTGRRPSCDCEPARRRRAKGKIHHLPLGEAEMRRSRPNGPGSSYSSIEWS